MSTSSRPSVRAATALLALAALLAYGPLPSASAEPASAEEARTIARSEAKNGDGNTSPLPGPADKRASGREGAAKKGGASGGKANRERPAPPSKKLRLTIPRLGLENVKVGDSPDQSYLDREGIMHLSGTGFPYQKGSNTYIAAHAIGYAGSRVTYAFRDLEDMKKGDRVIVRDAAGRTYKYRVYERMIVDPDDFWVTKPVEGKKVISLQTCWPEPSFEKRLIVRAKIVK
jgi:sortase A